MEHERVFVMLWADSMNSVEFSEQIAIQLKKNTVGLIYFDLKRFGEIEKRYGRKICDRILGYFQWLISNTRFAKQHGIFLHKIVGDDVFIFLTLPKGSITQQTIQIQEKARELQQWFQQQLNDRFDLGQDQIELYMGATLLNSIEEQNLNSLMYLAIKKVLLEAKGSSDFEKKLLQAEFQDILRERLIQIHYQPIVSLATGQVYAYEALSRGPQGSYFRSPISLFNYAEQEGSLYALEKITRELAIEGFFARHPNQKLFINLNANVIHDPQFTNGETRKLLKRMKLSPQNIVFEITERTSIEDFSTFSKALEYYRKQGFQIAIDDAGAGYSSLQSIAELRPDYIKIDRSLIQNIDQDKMKQVLLETLTVLAEKTNSSIIAEGIETPAELKTVTRLGVDFGQGFLLGQPKVALHPVSEEIRRLIAAENSIRSDAAFNGTEVKNIVRPAKTFAGSTQVSEVVQYFNQFKSESGVVIVRGDQPVGVVMRDKLFQGLAFQYGVALYWNKSIEKMMDGNPLLVEETTSIEAVSRLAMTRDLNRVYDLVLVTRDGSFTGIVTIQSILDAMTSLQMELARDANPLTGLPGNQRIEREIYRRIQLRQPFSVIYVDLDHFKWFNDTFGFQKGDMVIQFVADILKHAGSRNRFAENFIGHIGGDDFLFITNTDGTEICSEIVASFERGIHAYYQDATEIGLNQEGVHTKLQVTNRAGQVVSINGITISLACLNCSELDSGITVDRIIRRVGSLKQLAKKETGTTCIRGSLQQSHSFLI